MTLGHNILQNTTFTLYPAVSWLLASVLKGTNLLLFYRVAQRNWSVVILEVTTGWSKRVCLDSLVFPTTRSAYDKIVHPKICQSFQQGKPWMNEITVAFFEKLNLREQTQATE